MNITWPSISILVMGHNQEKYMAATIESCFEQAYEGELEIILCDDCSTDETFAIMQRMAAHYQGPYRVITHRCAKNGRVAVNMNVAVGLSSHPWLMRVDGDDILHPDRARLTALAILRYPDVKAISGELIPFCDERPDEAHQNPADEELIFDEVYDHDFTGSTNILSLQWWGCMMTLSRDIFSHFGPLPPQCYVLDDTMFATRALMLGSFVRVKNGVMLYYRRHEGNISSWSEAAKPSLRQRIKNDAATRDYYRRGLPCHAPILAELYDHCATPAGGSTAQKDMCHFFERYLAELRRQALFWDKSWRARIADARIKGAWWRKIPWAIRCSCPMLYSMLGR